MKQDNKELLLQDLCARLPYGVMIHLDDFPDAILMGINNGVAMLDDATHDPIHDAPWNIEYIKPYLFPISSMTEEQREEFLNIQTEERQILLNALIEYKSGKYDKIPIIAPYKQIEWLNKNHFDYRGLIERGLAIDCTNLNIY